MYFLNTELLYVIIYQHDWFFRMGGIIPPFARDLHEQNIDDVVSTALREAGVTLQVGVCV